MAPILIPRSLILLEPPGTKKGLVTDLGAQWFDFERDLLYPKALRWTNLCEPEFRRAYSTALATLDLEERKQVQNLVTSDHNAIFPEPNEKPVLQLDGLW